MLFHPTRDLSGINRLLFKIGIMIVEADWNNFSTVESIFVSLKLKALSPIAR